MNYPIRVKYEKEEHEAYSNGSIIIEDDVWIGMNSTILSGVTVGKGAVIAYGSVVVKNVPPFAIVGGNPAKLIRYRFNEDLISRLTEINYTEIQENKINQNLELLSQDLDKAILEDIIKNLYHTDE
jgi:tetrahydrodipicolinate N-succinyltransferase